MSTTYLRTPEEKGLWRRVRQYLVKKAPTLRKLKYYFTIDFLLGTPEFLAAGLFDVVYGTKVWVFGP
jgi:hypothetical protein